MGASALSSLHTQRGHLKGAHRRALDVLNTLGLSSSLMRVIERKEGVNAAITYGCMVLTVCIVIFMYVYYR
jgi:Golgi SNAP receptor complex protein 2